MRCSPIRTLAALRALHSRHGGEGTSVGSEWTPLLRRARGGSQGREVSLQTGRLVEIVKARIARRWSEAANPLDPNMPELADLWTPVDDAYRSGDRNRSYLLSLLVSAAT